jgi:hypothetical protein
MMRLSNAGDDSIPDVGVAIEQGPQRPPRRAVVKYVRITPSPLIEPMPLYDFFDGEPVRPTAAPARSLRLPRGLSMLVRRIRRAAQPGVVSAGGGAFPTADTSEKSR